jgi:hypothetical protein
MKFQVDAAVHEEFPASRPPFVTSSLGVLDGGVVLVAVAVGGTEVRVAVGTVVAVETVVAVGTEVAVGMVVAVGVLVGPTGVLVAVGWVVGVRVGVLVGTAVPPPAPATVKLTSSRKYVEILLASPAVWNCSETVWPL